MLADQEVVLSAGGIASPKVLMLSGIGPAADLREHGIDVVADVPGVGQNLMEHPHATLKYQVTERTLNTEVTPFHAIRHGLDFAFRRRGALTTGFNQAIVFAESDAAKWCDIEMQFICYGVSATTSEAADEYGMSHEVHSVGLDKYHAVSAIPAFLHPSGRGTIGLRSDDPMAPPVIRHELIGNPDDMAGLLAGVKLARSIFRQPAIRKYVVEEKIPGESAVTDDDLRAYLRSGGFTGKHPAGTCKMGVDELAVVDPRLRVRGVEGLRVVDASIMPVIVSGNTNSSTIMIAEHAADIMTKRVGSDKAARSAVS